MSDRKPHEGQRTHPTCGARKKSGGRCTQGVPAAGKRCHWHGGAPGSGRPLVHGRYSKTLKGKLLAAYQSSLADPKLMDLSETTAALDGLVRTIAERLQNGDTPEFRRRAVEMVDAMIAARGQPDGEAGKKFQELVTFLRAGEEESRAESILFDRFERLAKRVEEANKILHAKENTIPARKVEELMTALVAALNAHVDESKRRAVLSDLSSTWGEPVNRVSGALSPN